MPDVTVRVLVLIDVDTPCVKLVARHRDQVLHALTTQSESVLSPNCACQQEGVQR